MVALRIKFSYVGFKRNVGLKKIDEEIECDYIDVYVCVYIYIYIYIYMLQNRYENINILKKILAFKFRHFKMPSYIL